MLTDAGEELIMLLEYINRVLGKAASSSRIHARERLRLVLVHDRAKMSPYFMNQLKEDLNNVIARYMVIDFDKFEIVLDQSDKVVELKTSVPIKKIRRDYMDRIKRSS